MTKDAFIKFYDLFTQVIKQGIGDEYCMNASAKFVNYCGGYALELHPSCLLWGDEIVLLQGLCHRFNHSLEIHMQSGLLIIW